MPSRDGESAESELFAAIGDYGPWQRSIFVVIFYAYTVGIWQNFAMTFLAPNVPFRCIEPNVSYPEGSWPGQCSVQLEHDDANRTEMVRCTRWEYDTSEYSETLVSEWDLVCDHEWLISFSKSIYMIGFMASVFIFGQLSDWIGRYPTIVLCYIIYIVSLILSLFSTSMETFLAFRVLQAFGRTGSLLVLYALLMEITGPRHRTFLSMTVMVAWSTGFTLLGLVGYFFRHWFWFQVAITIPVLPLVLAYRIIPESPRWLMIHKKMIPLRNLIKLAAKKNGRNIDPDEVIQNLATVKFQKKGTLPDLFRNSGMRTNILTMMYLWTVQIFMYYAVSYNTNDLSGNPYLNFLLAGLVEFPAYGLVYFTSTRLGRKPTLVALMMTSGASFIAVIPVPSDMVWLSTSFSLCGRFCVVATLRLLYFWTGELFPTVVRSSALGFCSTVGRVGSIVAPFSRELSKASHPSVPNILNCVLTVSSGFCALWLPETRDRKLPDSLQEGEFQATGSRRAHINEETNICLGNETMT